MPTKKQHYTSFLSRKTDIWFCSSEHYLNLPRKEKKRMKVWARKRFYYSKDKGISIFNPKLLKTPFPKGFCNLFVNKDIKMPVSGGETLRFNRFKEKE
jgi:hypothetical protein